MVKHGQQLWIYGGVIGFEFEIHGSWNQSGRE
jgi:hypothetical protein